MEGRGYESGGRERVYTYRYTVTTRMTCIKMGSDESHFNVSLIVRDKVTRQCPQTTTFLKRKGAEAVSNRGPSTYQPTALALGQTGSQGYTPRVQDTNTASAIHSQVKKTLIIPLMAIQLN